jgi:acetyl-CoA carboxylase/biotin carboxylase 1
MRDMYEAILKFGSMIVEKLVGYKQPVLVYVPPGGELRGGAWVVIDPTINKDQMEMFVDPSARGGILEPAGIVEIKYRRAQILATMSRLDPEIAALNLQLASASDEVNPDPQTLNLKSRVNPCHWLDVSACESEQEMRRLVQLL